ncbi:MaoC/PaaZ C-terminal domain-containing protein [Echinimonas agarilytica]|uniref:MaoC-like domain-containing protein n=1 Tax=Echinimonas agarilytica TaxID=1215918 RepID=A0AA41W8X2_9GAMM|nr:MaoC/PaaZ C-terminal domain-containing protein [Echinimonas agarilytica]MCM2680866.1 hypothetical protein [Echinimonas agarilytica]
MTDNRVPKTLILEQGTMLRSFASLIGREILSFTLPAENPSEFEVISSPISLPSERLINHYVQWSGASADRYRAKIPPHLFFHLAMPMCIQQLKQSRYPLGRIINQGCGMVVNHPIPYQSEINAEITIQRLRETAGRVRIIQHVAISTAEIEHAIELEIQTLLPLGPEAGRRPMRKEDPRIFQPLGQWTAIDSDGSNFALLTGDFNPIHWSDIAGKFSPFGSKVLHGFGTFVRTYELLQTALNRSVHHIDVRFTAPLKLPGGQNTLLHSEQTGSGSSSIPFKLQDQHDKMLMIGSYSCE